MKSSSVSLAQRTERPDSGVLPGSRRPRVLHVIEATLGGTLVYLDTIISSTAGLPFDFAVAYSTLRATPALELALARARNCGWQTFRLEMTRAVQPRHDFRSGLDLARLYRSFRPDVVHCHSSKAGALGRLARLAVPFRNPRLVYTPNAVAAPLGRQYLLIERALAPLTTRMIPVSDSEANELIDLRLTSPGRYKTVDPVVDTTYFNPRDQAGARLALGLHRTAPIIVAVGRLTAQKGPMTFLSILKGVLETVPEAQGIWVGDGEMREEFLQTAHDLGIASSITLVGWKDDVRPWLAAADLLLSTSQYESFGYMVAECLAMERPVVATNVTGTCDILRGELSAWLYTQGDTAGATALVRSLLSDPTLCASIGVAGREMVIERFSPSVMRQALFSLYAELS